MSEHAHCWHGTDDRWCCLCVPAVDWPLPVSRVENDHALKRDADSLADRLEFGGPRAKMRWKEEER